MNIFLHKASATPGEQPYVRGPSVREAKKILLKGAFGWFRKKSNEIKLWLQGSLAGAGCASLSDKARWRHAKRVASCPRQTCRHLPSEHARSHPEIYIHTIINFRNRPGPLLTLHSTIRVFN